MVIHSGSSFLAEIIIRTISRLNQRGNLHIQYLYKTSFVFLVLRSSLKSSSVYFAIIYKLNFSTTTSSCSIWIIKTKPFHSDHQNILICGLQQGIRMDFIYHNLYPIVLKILVCFCFSLSNFSEHNFNPEQLPLYANLYIVGFWIEVFFHQLRCFSLLNLILLIIILFRMILDCKNTTFQINIKLWRNICSMYFHR